MQGERSIVGPAVGTKAINQLKKTAISFKREARWHIAGYQK
jgi:hypothetical protein